MLQASFKILLVEDDAVDRLAVKRVLESIGMPVNLVQASCVSEAIKLLRAEPFDCLLTDYKLGPETAFDLLQQIERQIGEPPSTVLLTGMGSETLAIQALQQGVCDYVSKDDLTPETLGAAIGNALDLTIRRQEFEQEHKNLEMLSLYDQLTELPNRSLFLDRIDNLIETSKRNSSSFAVLMMDLDGFKQINDRYGHPVGDQLLAEVGKRLQVTARESDTFARFGGDEFTALLPGVESMEGVFTIVSKLVKVIADPTICGDLDLDHGVSIGISLFPRHGNDADTLLGNADQAMYKAKNAGLDYCLFDAADSAQDDRELRIAEAMPGIATEPGLMLCYQPKVCLQDARLRGAEVLIRWRHPELGLLPPAEFIPAAERSAVIRELTYEVVRQAAEQLQRWRAAGFEMPLSINLSPMLIEDEELPQRLVQILQNHALEGSAFMLEITEASLVINPRRARQQLDALVDAGFRISLDDFGTGYCSLQDLRDFPFQEIKIDQTFVKYATLAQRDSSIISAIVKLAEGFAVDCVAEGIETDATWECLRQLGCSYGQGYLIAEPQLAEEFIDWKSAWETSGPSRRRSATA